MTQRVDIPKLVPIRNVSGRPQQVAHGNGLGFPMNTAFLVVIMSLVTLHVAALVGGGLVLVAMRLLGRAPESAPAAEGRESIP